MTLERGRVKLRSKKSLADEEKNETVKTRRGFAAAELKRMKDIKEL